MRTAEKIILNAIVVVGVAVATAMYKGIPFDSRSLGFLLLLALPFGALLWLRWDWAPKEGRRRRAERKRKRKAQSE